MYHSMNVQAVLLGAKLFVHFQINMLSSCQHGEGLLSRLYRLLSQRQLMQNVLF